MRYAVMVFSMRRGKAGGYIHRPRPPIKPKMNIGIERTETDLPTGGMIGQGFFYDDPTWISGFENSAPWMSDWVGRYGQRKQSGTNYWLTLRNKLQFEFRHLKSQQPAFLNGGT